MKRFLVFVIICIVTLSLGLTTYYFLRDNETLIVLETYYEINLGESFDIELEHINPKVNTNLYYEIHQSDKLRYNPVSENFESKAGGRAVITVTSNKSGFLPVVIEVKIGDGTPDAPYLIRNEEELSLIGIDPLRPFADINYEVTTDLDLSTFNNGVWIPIGNDSLPGEGFSSTISFNGFTVYNLNVTEEDPEDITIVNAGLFSVLESGATVEELILESVDIQGDFETAGAVAGINHGTIRRITINSGSIDNSSLTGYVGGVAGISESLSGDALARIDRVESIVVLETAYRGGGLVGKNYGGIVINSYSGTSIITGISGKAGGLVGVNEYKTLEVGVLAAKIKDSYFLGQISSDSETDRGAILAENIEMDPVTLPNIIYGVYYSNEVDETITGIAGILNEDLPENIGIYSKTLAEMTQKLNYFSYENLSEVNIYWVFGDVWTVDATINGGYPYLNMEGDSVSDNFEIANVAQNISSIQTLIDINHDAESLAGHYVLTMPLDLSSIENWIPIGTEETPFTGTFTVYNPDNTISGLNITTERDYNGLFGYIENKNGSERIATIEGLNLVNPKIVAGSNVGAIAGALLNGAKIINSTVIDDGSSGDEIGLSGSNIGDTTNIGGIVGYSSGSVSGCYSNVTINPDPSASATTNVGGLVGYMLDGGFINSYKIADVNGTFITKAYSHSDSIIESVGAGVSHIGGLVGDSNGIIEKAYFDGKIIASVETKNIYVGGLVAKLGENGQILQSYVDSRRIEGYAAGGIVGVSRGYVSESYSSISALKGQYIGGLAYNIQIGTFSNCYTTTNLVGVNSDSEKAGFAYAIGYSSSSAHGRIENSISLSTFTDAGSNYAETTSPIRTEIPGLIPREAGYIVNSVYASDFTAGTIKQTFNFAINLPFVLNWDWVDIEPEVSVTEEHMMGDDEQNFYTLVTQEGFNRLTIWRFEVGVRPALRNVVNPEDLIEPEQETELETEPEE